MTKSRKTDSVAAGVTEKFEKGWGPRPAFALTRNDAIFL